MAFHSLLPAYHIPKTLSPALQQACEKRLKQPAEQQPPRKEYQQQEAFVPLIKTLGKQPVSVSQIGFAGLGALLFTVASQFRNKHAITYYGTEKPDGNQLLPEDTLGITYLAVKEISNKLNLEEHHFYYTTEKNGVQQHWYQYNQPEYNQVVRIQQAHAFDASRDAPRYNLPIEAPLAGGIKQTFNNGGMVSEWQDTHGTQWVVNHTWETHEIVNPFKNVPGAAFSEKSKPTVTHFSLTWQDKTLSDVQHQLTFGANNQINYLKTKAGIAQTTDAIQLPLSEIEHLKVPLPEGVNLQALGLKLPPVCLKIEPSLEAFPQKIKDIDAVKQLETYLTQHFPTFNAIPSFFSRFLDTLQQKVSTSTVKPLYPDTHCENQLVNWVNRAILEDIQKALLPTLEQQLSLDWQYLSTKNQPLKENGTKTFTHRLLGMLPVGVTAFTMAGLAVLGVHNYQEQYQNQATLNALGQAKEPTTITIAQAKKHALLA
jgi:hypothetical protein